MSSTEPKPCPFCGVSLVPNTNQADLSVRRYGTHYDHPSGLCHLADHEVSPGEVEDWNRREALAAVPASSVPNGRALLERSLAALEEWQVAGSLREELRQALASAPSVPQEKP